MVKTVVIRIYAVDKVLLKKLYPRTGTSALAFRKLLVSRKKK